VNGLPFCHTAGRTSAERTARIIRDLAGRSPNEIRDRLRHEIAESLSLDRLREEIERVRTATRPLAWMSDLHFAGLFVALPVLVGFVHVERALLLYFPAFVTLQLGCVVALIVAHRRLHPGSTGAMVEDVISAAVYPPNLLRALCTYRIDALAAFHPATVAAMGLPDDRRRDFLRAELIRTQHAKSEPSAADCTHFGLAEMEYEGLVGLALSCGDSVAELMAPRLRTDSVAQAYCPVCSCEYLANTGECPDCEIALVPYPDP
jgi:hypothetical protein